MPALRLPERPLAEKELSFSANDASDDFNDFHCPIHAPRLRLSGEGESLVHRDFAGTVEFARLAEVLTDPSARNALRVTRAARDLADLAGLEPKPQLPASRIMNDVLHATRFNASLRFF